MPRPETDLDPHKMEVRPKKKNRKHRTKPEPYRLNKENAEAARAKLDAMPPNPGVLYEPCGKGWRPTSPHNDIELWEMQIAAAFGSNSTAVIQTFFGDLESLCRKVWDQDAQKWRPSEREVNAALAMVNDIQPRNTTEAALAAQMVAVHWIQMRLAKDALNGGGMVLEKSASLASKMARTYTMQLDQLRAMRGERKPVKQTIKVVKEVHQHVHYHRYNGEGVGETSDQSQAKEGGELINEATGRIADLREVPGDNAGGEVLPFASGKGEAGV